MWMIAVTQGRRACRLKFRCGRALREVIIIIIINKISRHIII